MTSKAVLSSYYDELVTIMQDASAHGAECYIYYDKNCCLWGMILTENQNILCIQRDTYEWEGWTFTFKYQPSREHGQGCQCLEKPLSTVTYTDILQAEQEGLRFARRLGAELYVNAKIALSKMYRFKDMKQIIK